MTAETVVPVAEIPRIGHDEAMAITAEENHRLQQAIDTIDWRKLARADRLHPVGRPRRRGSCGGLGPRRRPRRSSSFGRYGGVGS